MTREDTKIVLDRICRLYITQAKKLSATEKKMMVDTWQDTFKHESYDHVNNAVSRYIAKGNAFMPLATDIIKELTSADETRGPGSFTETDKLFKKLVETADMLANNKERTSLIDPGGYRWSDEHQRRVYYHAESVVSTTSYTQYDFKQLPDEIQEYVEDIEGLRSIWREIESSRAMARRRFEMALPGIKAELKRREEQLIEENKRRMGAM